MTCEEAWKERKKYEHFSQYIFKETINQVLMDLYIAFQDNLEEAVDSRKFVKKTIAEIVNSFQSVESEDRVNWELRPSADRWVYPEILDVLNFILKENQAPLNAIPPMFRERLRDTGRMLSVKDFFRYRN